MGLEFTGRPDREGAAAYFISDGSSTSATQLQAIADVVDTQLPEEAQVVLLNSNEREGSEVVDFYSIGSLPAILIVMDDDQIYQQWSAPLPTAEDIIYMMGQAGVRLRGDQ